MTDRKFPSGPAGAGMAPSQTNDTEERKMSVYMVERSLPGISMEALAGAQKAAIATAGEMRGQGSDIRYIRSTFAPEDGRCMCLFDGESAEFRCGERC